MVIMMMVETMTADSPVDSLECACEGNDEIDEAAQRCGDLEGCTLHKGGLPVLRTLGYSLLLGIDASS